MSNVISIHDHQTKAWEAYVSAQKRAQETMSFEDGVAAGKAWRRWLDIFLTEDQRSQLRKASA